MPIEITQAECAVIAAALRYQANDTQSTILGTGQRIKVMELFFLANAIEGRAAGHIAYEAAMQELRKDTTP